MSTPELLRLDHFIHAAERKSPQENIAQLAYAIWQSRGCPDNSAENDWIEAEMQLSNSPVETSR